MDSTRHTVYKTVSFLHREALGLFRKPYIILNTFKQFKLFDKINTNHNKSFNSNNNCNSKHQRIEYTRRRTVLIKINLLENFLCMNINDLFFLPIRG